jgi:CDP-paratose 2-epimerase
MKILITGGCGFLGSNLAVEAIKRNFEFAVFDNLSRLGSEENLKWLQSHGKFKFICQDIRNQTEVETAFLEFKPDVIFHLAGQVAMTTSISNPRADFDINALGALNVLEAARKHCPNALIVYSSTNKVYGDLEWVKYEEQATRYVAPDYPNGFAENIGLAFVSPYGCSKGSADQYMLDYHKTFNLSTVVLRHSSMYGGRQFATYDQGWVGWFCSQGLITKSGKTEKPFTISGNGKQVRDLLHSEDMVNLYFRLVDNAEKVSGEVFNIGGGVENSLSLLELFNLLEEELGVKLKYTQLPPRLSDQKIFIADLTKITKSIGWKPQVSKLAGIKKMLDWLRNQ